MRIMNTVEVKLKTFTEGVEESDKVMKGQEEQFNPLKTKINSWFAK